MAEEIKTPRTDDKSISAGMCLMTASVVDANFARKLERDLILVTQERDALRKKLDEAYERAAQIANEFDFGLDSQSGLVEAIRSLKRN